MQAGKIIAYGIVASCKPWGREVFEFLSERFPQSRWVFAANTEELDSYVAETSIDVIFFVHWNWFVPTHITSNVECLCLHMTDLPFGRGGSPLQNLILLGHEKTMLSIFRMESELDAGPIYLKRELLLHGSGHDIYLRMVETSKLMIEEIITHNPIPIPQDGEVVFFKRRKPSESEIPLDVGLDAVYDFIRMLDAPTYPMAFIVHGSLKISFYSVTQKENQLLSMARFEILENLSEKN